MVVNSLQNGLINSSIALWASRVNCQNIFFSNGITYLLLVHNSDRDFNSENNNVSQV
jgi:hypothetical protein